MRHMKREPVFIALLLGAAVCNGQSASGSSSNTRLFSKIYGCEAAVTIGNAMGVPVERWTWEKIETTYGFLDKFVAEEGKQAGFCAGEQPRPPLSLEHGG